jgi:septal ring factor EnvC (AmiA/AmiB activator)
MGPEKRNRVRGYGVGVKWSDIPGIVTENSGITNRVQALNDAYEAQREAHERREAEMSKQLRESAERESKLQADFEVLNKKMDAWQAQVGAHSLANILAAAGISSIKSLDLYLCQTASELTDMKNVPNNGQITLT